MVTLVAVMSEKPDLAAKPGQKLVLAIRSAASQPALL